jgi:hypothetical protein
VLREAHIVRFANRFSSSTQKFPASLRGNDVALRALSFGAVLLTQARVVSVAGRDAHRCEICRTTITLMSHCSMHIDASRGAMSRRCERDIVDARGTGPMKIALAPQYRFWMFALLPTTLGLGTAALWARSLNWPLRIDSEGLTLRYRRKVPWKSIKKISVWRNYRDGHVSRMDIHHKAGTSKIPVRGLQDGEKVAGIILTSFKQARNAGQPKADAGATSVKNQRAGRDHHHPPTLPRFLVRQ